MTTRLAGSNHSEGPGKSSRRARRTLFVLAGAVLLTVVVLWLLFRAAGFVPQRSARAIDVVRAATPGESSTGGTTINQSGYSTPQNTILFVADGLGFAHLSASRAVHHGIDGPAVWDRFTTAGWVRPHPSRGFLTDSAAAATAMATGIATTNGAVGVNSAGQPLVTLLERAAALGKSTGIVTDSYIWDATPAAFAAHVSNRGEAAGILQQLATADLDVLFGELEDAGEGGVPSWEATVTMLSRRYALVGPGSVNLEEEVSAVEPGKPVAAIFEEDQITDLTSSPSLPALTSVALSRMNSTARGFVLIVESEEVDTASHRNDFPRVLRGLQSIEATVELILDFATTHDNTLVVFTADHETGALSLGTNDSNDAVKAWWGSSGHSGSVVPLLAFGPGSARFAGGSANWQLGQRLARALEESGNSEPGKASSETPSE